MYDNKLKQWSLTPSLCDNPNYTITGICLNEVTTTNYAYAVNTVLHRS